MYVDRPIQFIPPLRAAYRRMTRMLFHPIDIGKWFANGFTAWLAQLGPGFSVNVGSGGEEHRGAALRDGLTHFAHEHMLLVISLAGVLAIVFIAVALVLLWLSSRGKFMFLDNVLRDRALVGEPWRRLSGLGHSLFRWYIGFFLALVLASVFFGGAAALLLQQTSIAGPIHRGSDLFLVGVLVLVLLAVLLAIGVTLSFLDSFVIPLMLRHHESASAAWRRFGRLFRDVPGAFLLYELFLGVLILAFAFLVLVFACATCCCGVIVLVIPYVGTVLLLPVPVLFRLYSVEFLQQFGPDYDVNPAAPPPMPVADGT